MAANKKVKQLGWRVCGVSERLCSNWQLGGWVDEGHVTLKMVLMGVPL